MSRYRRRLPERTHKRIVTKKAKIFGKIMYSALVAGGHPAHFRPDKLRDRVFEELIDTLLPNDVHFDIYHREDYETDREIEVDDPCPICGFQLEAQLRGGVKCPNIGCDYWECF